MKENQLKKAILESDSLEQLNAKGILPDPCADDRYYLFWYAAENYKTALSDIVTLTMRNVNIWYDRYNENGEWWRKSILERIKSYDCKGVVIYLSETAMVNPFLYALCLEIENNGKSYFTVNCEYDKSGNCLSGEQIIEIYDIVKEIPEKVNTLYQKLFSKSITYVPSTASLNEKERALSFLKPDDFFTYEYDDENLEATTYTIMDSAITVAEIPPYTEKNNKRYTVTAIGAYTFANCRFLEKLRLPSTLREIGKPLKGETPERRAKRTSFESDFPKLFIGSSAEELLSDGYTFFGCNALKELCFSPTVKKVYNNTFVGAIGLEYISLPGLEECGSNSFCVNYLDTRLKRIELSDAFVKSENSVFLKKEFKVIEMPENCIVEGLNTYEFSENAVLEEGVKEINGLFTSNNKIKSVVLPKSLQFISYREFNGCNALEKVEFKCAQLASFEDHEIFEGCDNLKEVVLPYDTKMVNLKMFDGLKNLKELVVPASVNYASYINVADYKKEYKRLVKQTKKDARKRLKQLKEEYGRAHRNYLTALAEYKANYTGNNNNDNVDEYDSLCKDDCHIETLIFENGNYFQKYHLVAKLVKMLSLNKSFAENTQNLARLVRLNKMKNSCIKMPSLKRIYLKNQGQKVSLKHYRQVKSDREGYLLFKKK